MSGAAAAVRFSSALGSALLACMLSVITRNRVPDGLPPASRSQGTLNPMTGHPTTSPAASTTTTDQDRMNAASGSNSTSGRARIHRGANIRIVAGHHRSAH